MERIGIIGSGFCGTALAIQLLQRAVRPLHILLFNRSGRLARGLAYGTRSNSHILNVPAERMSLFPEKPSDFLEFARQELPAAQAGDFLPRRLYGDYLQTRLDQAIAQRSTKVDFDYVHGHVIDLSRESKYFQLRLDNDQLTTCDRVVIATGNFSPATPQPLRELLGDPRYIEDPWRSGALDTILQTARVLLLGTGLTMYDVALTLHDRGHATPLQALSRRALLPHGHRDNSHHPLLPELPDTLLRGGNLRQLLAQIRAFVGNAEADGFDWRDAVAALRPITPALWQALDSPEQKRFLCHLQVYWDIHRHRAAPAIAKRIGQMRQSGALQIQAARTLTASKAGDSALYLQIRPRGSCEQQLLEVDYIINCTGPCNDLRSLDEPMLKALQARGELVQDDNRIGLKVDDHYRLQNAAGHSQHGFYLLSPMLRSRYWESTAVPELRQHAERLARQLLA